VQGGAIISKRIFILKISKNLERNKFAEKKSHFPIDYGYFGIHIHIHNMDIMDMDMDISVHVRVTKVKVSSGLIGCLRRDHDNTDKHLLAPDKLSTL
jgi:hypothetical protein